MNGLAQQTPTMHTYALANTLQAAYTYTLARTNVHFRCAANAHAYRFCCYFECLSAKL